MNRLHYITVGRPGNPVVVLLHGFMGSSADWAATAAFLEADFFCIAVDLPGHGRSVELADAGYTLQGAAQALLHLLADLDIETCTVVGYSMGGRLALFLALHAPERLHGLVMESASPGLPTEAERAARRAVDARRAGEVLRDFDGFLDAWYRQPLFASLARHEGLLERMLDARRQNQPQELARSLRGMGTGEQPSLWERLPGLRVSTLAVVGALDPKYVTLAQQMAARSPQVRAAVVERAGHNVHAERPAAFHSLLQSSLTNPDR